MFLGISAGILEKEAGYLMGKNIAMEGRDAEAVRSPGFAGLWKLWK